MVQGLPQQISFELDTVQVHPSERPKKDVSIIYGDCNLLIKDVADKSIDLIATDPPYEINFEKNNWDKPDILILAFSSKRI